MPDSHEKNAETLPVEVKRANGGSARPRPDLVAAGTGNWHEAEQRSLTRKERAVLAIICDPSMADATNRERYAKAGLSERRYYEILADPWFNEQHRRMIQSVVKERVGRLIEAGYQTAATPGRDGFQDRRMLLEMTGHYVKREQIDHTSGGQPIVGVIGVAMDDI
jgi:hypothetical protein